MSVNQDGRMASPRSYFMGRSPRPDSAQHHQFRAMQQQYQQQQFHQFQQQQQQQQHTNNQYNQTATMATGNHYSAQHQPGNAMVGYNNGPQAHMAAGISPTPTVRNQLGMQASPALAATAPQHFNGPAVCHQAQVGQPQSQQQQLPPMYSTCPAQSSPVVANGVVGAQQGQQQPNMVGCNAMQSAGYSQAANYGPTHANGVNPLAYNNYNNSANMPCNNQQTTMPMNSGYVMNQQCGHMQVAQQQPNPVAVQAQGFNNPCSPCTGHHHQQPQPVCNNNPANNQNWQCGYPGNNAITVPQQQQQQMSFQPQPHDNVTWQNNAMHSAGNGPTNHIQPTNASSIMYNNMQSNATMGNNYNNYNGRPPPYNQVASAIQCQDVSQSQDFINRTRVQGAGQQPSSQGPSATPAQQQQHSQQINNAATAVPSVATGVSTPSNMRPETYQRTLEYVQQCQTWSTTGDSNAGARMAKENKPPHQQQQPGACEPQMTKTAETAVVGRALLSPGQDAVSSSTDRQEAAAAAAAALLPSSGSANQSNMVVHDMNTSLNSLMQENRFLQMIQ